MFHAHLSFN